MARVKSNLSRRLIGGEAISDYGNKVKELAQIAETLAPEGGLYISLFDKSEMFLPSTKVIRDLMEIDSIYSNRAIQANPALAEEFKEVAEHIKAIDNIISKRRKKIFKRRKEEKKRKEEETND